jgi:hypothetical protein
MLMGALVGAILAVIGGLLGEGLARFLTHISGNEEAPTWPRLLAVLFAIGLTKPVLAYINKPTAESVMKDLEVKEPMYVTLREKAPAVYASIKSDIASSLDAGDSNATIRMKIQRNIRVLYDQKLPHASDANLRQMVEVVRDEARLLNETNPALCVQMLSEQGGDIGSSLTEDLKAREYGMLTEVVSETPQDSLPKASEAEMQSFVIRAVGNISAKLDVSPADVGNALQGKGSDQLRCQVSSELMDEFTKLPEASVGPMIRGVMFQGTKS